MDAYSTSLSIMSLRLLAGSERDGRGAERWLLAYGPPPAPTPGLLGAGAMIEPPASVQLPDVDGGPDESPASGDDDVPVDAGGSELFGGLSGDCVAGGVVSNRSRPSAPGVGSGSRLRATFGRAGSAIAARHSATSGSAPIAARAASMSVLSFVVPTPGMRLYQWSDAE